MKRVVDFALRQPLFLGLMMVIFVGTGIIAFARLPIEAFPDVSDTQVSVVTLYPGRAAEEVERAVTIPIEISLAGLPHNVRLFSHTQFGLSFIVLTFDDAVTDYFARQQVLEHLQTADLPSGVQPELAPLSTPIGEIYRYRIQGAGLSPMDLRTIQDWTVTRYLKMTPGVADIVTLGGLIKQYEVNPDPAKLRDYGISLMQLYAALGRSNVNAGGSYLEQGAQQYLVRGLGLLRSADDIGNVVVAERGTTPILVTDLATVTVSAVPRQGVVGQDRDDDVVTGIVLMRKGENPSVVLAALKQRVAELNSSILPRGVQVVSFYDRTWLIETTLHTVFQNLLEGALLVGGVLLLFLSNWRAAAIVVAIIPLSLLATFMGLSVRGIPANLLSLGAMDFGIIVDGAVIVVENVFRRLSAHTGPREPDTLRAIVLDAAADVGRPTFFSMLIIIVANIPIFTLQRQEGRIFAPMAWTVTSALLGSLLLSLTLVPLLCYWLLRAPPPHEENRLVRRCRQVYESILGRALQSPRIVLVAAALVLAASLVMAPKLGTEFLPELNEGTIWINLNLPPGISIAETMAQVARARALLATVPEVETTVSKAGRPEDGTDPKPLNMVEIFVGLKPTSQWRPHVTKQRIIQQMDEALATIPGIEVSFSQPIRDNVLESISQIDGQVVVKIFGDDLEQLRTTARRILAVVRSVRGVARAFIDRPGEVPQARLEIDRAQAARYGLNVADVEDQIELGLGGKEATQLWDGERHFAVIARLASAERQLSNLGRILIDTPDGQRIPLADVAHVVIGVGSMNISREGGRRVVAVGVFIRGRDMGSVVRDMQASVRHLRLPVGSYVTWSGEFENQQRAMRRLALIVPVSVFLIFVLLFYAFHSIKDSLLILLNVPFALIGGIVALLVTGIPLSVSAAIGFIALFGQSVLNGVVMITVFNQLRGDGLPAPEAVRRGAIMRMRTVLMTALLAMLGMLPMALSRGIGAETQKPLAVVIIGGLLSATLLVLVVLPTAYLTLERVSSRGDRFTPIPPIRRHVIARFPG
ncbi:MAG TPA: CusA/CzcA family heavy metal efflux RND transporter [Gemmatimonadales bacterium]|nr:CusA/CzcA family heavy metal efflux RND transporter [Gemmatimonadales bacterium]